MSKKIQGTLLLMIAALIWGSSFIVMKSATDFLTPAVLLFIRFSLASVFLFILFFNKIKTFPKENIIGGLLTGCCLFFAYYVQTWGLNFTTPGKNAFLTAVYCAIVPFLVWLFYHKRPDAYNFIAAFICVLGVGCVSLDANLSMNKGDFLTLCGGLLYAIHILLIKKFSKDVDGGAFTTFQFIGGSIVALIVSLINENISLVGQIGSDIYLQIFYLAFFATAVTMVCQTIGQNCVSECQASLILSLESVFGVLFSVLFYGEVLSMKMILGFILIFIAIVTSETKLAFLKKGGMVKGMLALFTIFNALNIINVSALNTPNVKAPYAYVYDLTTSQELYSKNADERIYPASMTKVMTALVALEHIDNLKMVTQIQEYDIKGLWEAGASSAYLEVGEKVTYGDLIHGIILPSGADACRAISRELFGSEEKMVEQMNKKAQELKLKNTHFMNATGLHHQDHYSSTHDMGIITREALKNAFFKDVFTKRSYKTEITQHYMAATLLKVYWNSRMDITHIKGCKTGYTDQSKSCITALVNSQGHDLITVFAKEDDSRNYVKDAKIVVDYYDKNYQSLTLYKKGDLLKTVDVHSAVNSKSDVKALEDVQVLVPKTVSKNELKIECVEEKKAVAPVQKGQNIGYFSIRYNDQEIRKINISIQEDIDAHILVKIWRYLTEHLFLMSVLVILIVLVVLLSIRYLKIREKRRRKAYKLYRQNKNK